MIRADAMIGNSLFMKPPFTLAEIVSDPCKKLRVRAKPVGSSPKSADMRGKIAVITGATAGIGLATAAELARKGVEIIGVGRSDERCRQAAAIVLGAAPGATVTYLPCDLSSLRQVRELAANIHKQLADCGRDALDILINDAGTVSSWYVSTQDGFELQFAVNHLAPFLLTNELLPLLKAAPAARVVTVSSGSHYRTRIRWNDVFMRRHYSCLAAYKQSKLANVMFTAELNRRLGPDSTVRAFAADPGLVHTDIGLKGTSGIERWVWARRSGSGDPPEKPAKAIAYLACEPSLRNSKFHYWKDCAPRKPSRYSLKPTETARLWELSEKMCGMEL